MPHKRLDKIAFYLSLLTAFIASPTAMAQSGGGRAKQDATSQDVGTASLPVAPTDEIRKSIAVTVWALTVSPSHSPEKDEPVGKLIAQAHDIPVVIGNRDEVRQLVDRFRVAGVLRKSREVRVMTLDGLAASAHSGSDQPRVTAVTITNFGRTNNTQYQPIGTVIQVAPRIDSTGMIQVSLTYHTSSMQKSKDVVLAEPTDGKAIMADLVRNEQATTTVRLKSGSAMLVKSDSTQETSDDSDGLIQLVILSAEIVAPE